MKLLVKIPTRERGLAWLDKWLENSSVCEFLISVDSNEYTDVQLPKLERVTFVVGESENKIHAINRDIKDYIQDYDVLAVFGDDFEPSKDFDKKILEKFEYCKDHVFYDSDFCLHFSDGYTHDRLCTYPIMGREYYEKYGVYCPEYKSIWADNEQTEMAKYLGKYAYFPDVVCVHRHYVNDKLVTPDALYRKNEAREAGDRATYERRKSQNFGVHKDWKLKSVVL